MPKKCSHFFRTIFNLYGDAIHAYSGARSRVRCIYCGKEENRPYLDQACTKANSETYDHDKEMRRLKALLKES